MSLKVEPLMTKGSRPPREICEGTPGASPSDIFATQNSASSYFGTHWSVAWRTRDATPHSELIASLVEGLFWAFSSYFRLVDN